MCLAEKEGTFGLAQKPTHSNCLIKDNGNNSDRFEIHAARLHVRVFQYTGIKYKGAIA